METSLPEYKVCKTCKIKKPQDGYYIINSSKLKRKILDTMCKACRKIRNDLNYQKHKDKYTATRATKQTEIREYQRNLYLERGEEIRQRALKYADNNREKINASVRKWRDENPEKYKVALKFNRAVRLGRIIPPDTCQCCNRTPDQTKFNKRVVEGHHMDYDHWDWVLWLCRSCHRRFHKGDEEVVQKCELLWDKLIEGKK